MPRAEYFRTACDVYGLIVGAMHLILIGWFVCIHNDCMSLHSWGGAPIIRGAQGWQTPLAMEQMMIESSIVPCAHIDASSSVRISSNFD